MFQAHAGDDLLDQIRFAADEGFTSWEDNRLREREPAFQEKMGALLDQLGMTMGVFDAAWPETAYFQGGDNPGRNEPGTGEINYRDIFRHLQTKGYAGVVGMEHNNSRPGKAGERAVIDADRAADGSA